MSDDEGRVEGAVRGRRENAGRRVNGKCVDLFSLVRRRESEFAIGRQRHGGGSRSGTAVGDGVPRDCSQLSRRRVDGKAGDRPVSVVGRIQELSRRAAHDRHAGDVRGSRPAS